MAAIGPWGWWHLACFGLALPLAALRSRARLAAEPRPPRVAFLASVVAQQLLFLLISLGVAWAEGITLFPAEPPGLAPLAAALGLFGVSWAGLRPLWRRAVLEREPRVHLTSPRTTTERRLWVGLSLAAGIGEEVTYRGVAYVLLYRLTDSAPAAALVAAAGFGAGHVVQGWKATWITALFALVAQGLTLWSGSLYAAILWHVAYDVAAGLTYGRMAEQLGYDAAPPGQREGPPSPGDGGPARAGGAQ